MLGICDSLVYGVCLPAVDRSAWVRADGRSLANLDLIGLQSQSVIM